MNDEMTTPEEEVRYASTADEMRAELNRLEFYLPIIQSIWALAHYRGLSGEDKYTVLAYNAIKQNEELKKHILEQARMTNRPLCWKLQEQP